MGCHAMISISLIWILLNGLSTVGADGFQYFDHPGTTDFRILVTDNVTGHLFVAGINGLYEFDSSLNPIQEAHTGPTTENPECDSECSLVDDEPKVFIHIPHYPDSLLYCGTARLGLCARVKKANLSDIRYFDPGNKYNCMGSKETVRAFFGKKLNTVYPLYVAQQYDGRNMTIAPEVVSSRQLIERADGTLDIILLSSHPVEDVKTAKDIHASLKADYWVRYIYSFEYGKFTFFLTVQREDTNWGWYTTRLVRVCQEDSGYYSYAEIQMYCGEKLSFGKVYRIAEAAHLGPVSAEFAQSFRLDVDEPVLYVTFGLAEGHEPAVNKSYGSSTCLFSMEDIMMDFKFRLMECYEGDENLLPWIHPETSCTKDYDTLEIIIAEGVDFCTAPGSVYNDAAGRLMLAMQMDSNFTLKDRYATALRVVVQKGKIAAFLGTEQGTIVKVYVDGSHTSYHAEIDVARGLAERPMVARDFTLDPTGEYLYAMVGPRLVKLDLGSCAIYRDCASCVKAAWREPLECGWCNGQCIPEMYCAHSSWSKTSCPPILHSFEPKSGPLAGGTKVTITGELFGNFSGAVTKKVEVAYEDCLLMAPSYGTDRIICTTKPARYEKEGRVTVDVVDISKTSVSFQIRGSADSSPTHFVYKEPIVTHIKPTRGPRSGGTPVTLQGRNLDVGSHTRVFMVSQELPCTIISERSCSKELVCETSPLANVDTTVTSQKRAALQTDVYDVSSNALAEGEVVLQIDDAFVQMPDTLFSYHPDPYILDVNPRKSIASGGIQITVTGAYLDVVHQPKLVLYDPVMKYTYNDTDCIAHNNGLLLTCQSPTAVKYSNESTYPSEDKPQVLHIHFAMDGVSDLIDFPTTHPELSNFSFYMDPIIYAISDDVEHPASFDIGNQYLTIRGKHLSLGASLEDYHVTVAGEMCECKVLTDSTLKCRPVYPKPLAEEEPSRQVIVTVGNREYDLGAIYYKERNTELYIAIVFAPLALLIIVLIILVVLGLMKRHHTGPFKRPSLSTVSYTYDGDPIGNTYQRGSQMGAAMMPAESEPLVRHDYLQLIDPSILIERHQLKLQDVVGQGNFGCVYKGLLQYDEDKDVAIVAVKTLKTLAESRYANMQNAQEARAFLEEALRMREFDHPNILRLIGICFDEDEMFGQPMVVTPFMQHGDLLNYIRDDDNTPTIKILMEFGIQVAEGMAYLARLKFVHRDLAARNCMLDDNLNVLVADFGLSRDVYETEYYSSDGRRRKLPVKWMALESLEKGIYSTKTDVWSFGIVLWELMTRGVTPYPEVGNWEIIKYLQPGRRMPQPSYCPDPVYELMMECWNPDGNQRPGFDSLAHRLRQIIFDMEQELEDGDETQSAIASAQAPPLSANVPTTQEYLYPNTQDIYVNKSAMSTSYSLSMAPTSVVTSSPSYMTSLQQPPSVSTPLQHMAGTNNMDPDRSMFVSLRSTQI